MRPTFVFGLAFLLGVMADALVPIGWTGAPVHEAGTWLGTAAIVAGAALFVACLGVFYRLRTGIMPHRPARRLVTFGPYRWSRNPMFVAFALIYVGAALVLGSVWTLLLLPVAIALTNVAVVEREESYLRKTFGTAYDAYAGVVPRWVGRRRSGGEMR